MDKRGQSRYTLGLMAGGAAVWTGVHAQTSASMVAPSSEVSVWNYLSAEQRREVRSARGLTDSTTAMAAALGSGTAVVRVPKGRYVIQAGVIQIPPCVTS